MADFAPKPVASSEGTSTRDSAREPVGTWAEAAEQLRSLRDAQKRAWGNVDSSTLGRYLADEVDASERARVEAEMASHPELARLTELVRDVLADFQPDEAPAPVIPAPIMWTPDPMVEAPLPVPQQTPQPPPVFPSTTPDSIAEGRSTSLPFAPRPRRMSFFRRFRHEISLLAAAGVLVAVGWAILQYGGAIPVSPPSGENFAMRATDRDEITLPPDTVFLASLKPLEQLETIDQCLALAQAADKPVDPEAYEKVYYTQAKKGRLENHPRFAQSLESLGNCFKDQGQLARAEHNLKQSYNIRSNLKPNGPETLRVAENLAGVYQLALNTPVEGDGLVRSGMVAGPGLGGRAFAPPHELQVGTRPDAPPMSVQGKMFRDWDMIRQQDLRDVRRRIVGQSADKVRESIVPVLVQTLRYTSKNDERIGMMYALSRLGCAARDATPLILERLNQAETEHEKIVALRTLGRIGAGMPGVTDVLREVVLRQPNLSNDAAGALLVLGPTGRRALEQLGQREMELRKEMIQAKNTDNQNEVARRLQDRVEQLADIRKLANDPRMRTGVLDVACLFTAHKLFESNMRFHRLGIDPARQVFIETLPEMPSESGLLLGERARLVGTQGLYVLIASRPRAVDLQVASPLRQAGFNEVREQELNQTLERLLKDSRYDEIPDAIIKALPASAQPPE